MLTWSYQGKGWGCSDESELVQRHHAQLQNTQSRDKAFDRLTDNFALPVSPKNLSG